MTDEDPLRYHECQLPRDTDVSDGRDEYQLSGDNSALGQMDRRVNHQRATNDQCRTTPMSNATRVPPYVPEKPHGRSGQSTTTTPDKPPQLRAAALAAKHNYGQPNPAREHQAYPHGTSPQQGIQRNSYVTINTDPKDGMPTTSNDTWHNKPNELKTFTRHRQRELYQNKLKYKAIHIRNSNCNDKPP